MSIEAIQTILLIVVIVIIAIILVSNSNNYDYMGHGSSNYMSDKERAGYRGEQVAASIINEVLRPEDYHFRNVSFEYAGNEIEIDNLIINTRGVFIIEVKNYNGRLYGNETDYELYKEKVTDAGNRYSNIVKNPVPQVKRQIHNMAKFLESEGVNVWVEGYVYFVHGNCPFNSEKLLRNKYDIDHAIHPKKNQQLSKKNIETIVSWMSYQ